MLERAANDGVRAMPALAAVRRLLSELYEMPSTQLQEESQIMGAGNPLSNDYDRTYVTPRLNGGRFRLFLS